MRLKALLIGDVRFQIKYGFYIIYAVFSALYISLLFAFPAAWRDKAATLMIFTDPAAMGLYFMGSIVLLEKSERTLNSIAVSPVRPREYMQSKLLSIAVISVIVAVLIAFFGHREMISLYFIVGVFLCSCLFSAVGLIVAARSMTLNAFVLSTIPAELVITVPAIAYLFGWDHRWLLFHPGVCMIELSRNGRYALPAVLILTLWTVLAAVVAEKASSKMFVTMGGITL
jgi:fluoroquinolone transport system permease protein